MRMKWPRSRMPETLSQSWDAFGIALAGAMGTVLFCFLVVTPICTLGMVMQPPISTGTIVSTTERDLVIQVNRQGFTYIADEGLAKLDSLEMTLDAALRSGRYRAVLIEADQRTRYGSLMPIFKAARAANVPVRFAGATMSVLEQQFIDASRH